MKLTRLGLFLAGATLTLLVLADARSQDEKKGRFQPGGFGGGQGGPLVSERLAEKLDLTSDQKKKVEKLDKDFTEKTKDIVAKQKELREKAFKDRDQDAFKELREQGQALQKIRTDFEAKVAEVRKDDQKKTFEEAIKNRLGRFQGGPGGFGGGRGPATLLSPNVQEQLKLTAEQKEKLEKMKKDFDAKTLDVLTDEQKKKFEDLKKEGPRGGRPDGTRPGRPNRQNKDL